MRRKRVVYNGIWAVLSYGVLFFLGLINRRLFLSNYNDDLLGYQGIFANIFSLLSITEMGVGTVVSYRLYKEIEQHNETEIAKLMMVYKWMYRFIGCIMATAGLLLLPFVMKLVGDPSAAPNEVYSIYLICLVSTVSTYFMSFRRLLYICNQKNYICVITDTAFGIVIGFMKVAMAVWLVDYRLYFIVGIAGTVLSNMLIAYMCNRSYPYARSVPISFGDIKRIHFFKDVGFQSLQRIAEAVYGGIDNIIASNVLGVGSVVLLTNYSTIEASVTELLDKFMSGLRPAIGSVVYDGKGDEEKTYSVLAQMGFFLAVFVCISYFVLSPNFIYIWLGEQYILGFWFVLFFSLNQYIAWNHRIIGYYRSVAGHFEYDTPFSVFAAVMNVGLSIALSVRFGYSGLIFATFVSHIILWFGRAKLVYHFIFDPKNFAAYWKKEGKKFCLLLVELLLVYLVTFRISYSVCGLIIRILCCMIIPNLINFVLFYKHSSMQMIRGYMKNGLLKLKSKNRR